MTSEHETSILKEFTPALSGKVALITGGSKGIGLAIARRLSASGAAVILHARTRSELEKARAEIETSGGRCVVATVDARNEQAIQSSISALAEEFPGGVDVLINNAGIYKTSSVVDQPTEDWDNTIKTNLYGPFFYSRAVLPSMTHNGWGRIINISSISGRTGEIHAAAYSASKFGLNGFTQSLAMEVAAKGITVNAVCPGWVDTAMSREQLNDENWCKLSAVAPSESMDIARLSVPQMRFIEPSEVAELVFWLCTDAARGITGQSMNICGGMCLT
ncbi:MAG: SDR family oxidoreductase [Candidatus Obscuribacterales bacterium]|nr:SDR family oxidoreductase [Candidatus Obscuribacterales bacterium]